jgi:hypothetical protein
MRHFIAYHNTEKMGRPLHDSEPLRLLTNKPVNHLLQNIVWFVTGGGRFGNMRWAVCSGSPVTLVSSARISVTLTGR